MHMGEQRVPARAAYYDKKVALVLQGGGALGSYQAGVYEALASSEYVPDWVAGISIGAVNAAIIAGNAPEKRVARLCSFWEEVTSRGQIWPSALGPLAEAESRLTSLAALMFGSPASLRRGQCWIGSRSQILSAIITRTLSSVRSSA